MKSLQIPSFSIANRPFGRADKPLLFGGYFDMKKCNKCNLVFVKSMFRKCKLVKSGLKPYCASCSKKMYDNYRFSKRGVCMVMYHGMRGSSKKRGHALPKFSHKEFLEWAISNTNFNSIYTSWITGGMHKDDKPSIDRLSDDFGYLFENMQIITFKENREKYYNQVREGVSGHVSKSVIVTFDNGDTREYHSSTEAANDLGLSQSAVSLKCRGKLPQTNGLIFKYNQP
jgi:hypothetical protein